jgi:hypothetical protein
MSLDAGIDVKSANKMYTEVNEKKKDFVVFKIIDDKLQCTKSFPETNDDIEEFKNDIDKKTREDNWKTRVYPKLMETIKEETTPCFIVVDVGYTIEDNGSTRKSSKLIMIGWCPERTSVRNKMLFSGTLKKFSIEIQVKTSLTAHSISDVSYDEILERIK